VFEKKIGEDPEKDEELSRRRRKVDLTIGIALLAIALVGASLAQSISLSPNDRVEFGQGAVTLKACDSFISISLNPSAATFSGFTNAGQPYANASRVKSIQFSGLDTKACAGRSIKVQLYPDNSTTPLSLFEDSASTTSDRAVLVIDPDKTLDRAVVISLENGLGQNVGRTDSYQSLSYNVVSAIYTLEFSSPLALMSDVSRVGIETYKS
jgi:hypothetical protein